MQCTTACHASGRAPHRGARTLARSPAVRRGHWPAAPARRRTRRGVRCVARGRPRCTRRPARTRRAPADRRAPGPLAGRRAPRRAPPGRLRAPAARALVDEHLPERRQIGGHDGPPRGEVLEQLQRRAVGRGDGRSRGSAAPARVPRRRWPATSECGSKPREPDARAEAEGAARSVTRARSGSAGCPPTMSPSMPSSLGECAHEDVDALPGIEMAGVGGNERPCRGAADERPRRVEPGAVGHDGESFARAEQPGQAARRARR